MAALERSLQNLTWKDDARWSKELWSALDTEAIDNHRWPLEPANGFHLTVIFTLSFIFTSFINTSVCE